MAYIEGLKESEKALAEIKKIMKELEGINQFMSVENPTTLYRLSFSVKTPLIEEEEKTNIIPLAGPVADELEEHKEPLLAVIEDGDMQVATDAEIPEKKKGKKARKTIQYTAPLICDDKESLYYFVQLYKDKKVRTVMQLADTHRIFLTEEDKAILGIS